MNRRFWVLLLALLCFFCAARAETEETMELFSDVPWNSRGEERIRYREEINKENRTAVRLFARR